MKKVDIQPQWKKLAKWYWETLEGKIDPVIGRGMSIWEMLYHEYGATQQLSRTGYWATFPDESSYTAFLLKWS